jgi:gentisate 1,2-dioxygenase
MADDGFAHTVNREAEKGREEFYSRASNGNLAPLWRVLGGLVLDEPKSPCLPAIWKWNDVRPYLMEACKIITAEEAERRVLVLENPGMRGESRITRSLFAGLQTILPGEVAPAHRHVASALRFVIEGKNAYTAVSGERTMMSPGDFVITPSWTWHDHGNLSNEPMVWLDGLDMHLVNLMDAGFRDGYPDKTHPVTRPEGAADAEFALNLLPVDYKPTSQTTPIFNYPYTRSREALDKMAKFRPVDACFGYKMKFVNPIDGGWAMPTISTWMSLLPKGFKSMPYRSTDGVVFVCVEGKGKTRVGDNTFEWGPHDVWTVPSWQFHEHEASSDAVIFSFSDRVAQEKLDFWREQRGNA